MTTYNIIWEERDQGDLTTWKNHSINNLNLAELNTIITELYQGKGQLKTIIPIRNIVATKEKI